ncbi:acetyltransferase, possible [Pseudoalteromonas sp. SM9913]|nr:acetyltransferase, possible [Pseudoalteromonas sp. SM9913]
MSELITCVESEMYREGGIELRLYVHKDNAVAKRAYEKSGFSLSDYQIMALGKEH